MYVYIYIYIYIYTHTYIYIYTHRSASCKGDQAYFFLRKDECDAFANGAIVWLVDGRLVASSNPGTYINVCMYVMYVCICVCMYA